MTFQVIVLPALKLNFQLPILIHVYPQVQHHNNQNKLKEKLKHKYDIRFYFEAQFDATYSSTLRNWHTYFIFLFHAKQIEINRVELVEFRYLYYD